MASVGEIFKKLRNELIADAGLKALLGEGSEVYRAYPVGVHVKPFMILMVDNLNSQTQNTGVGMYRPDMTFDIIVLDPYDADVIYTYLEENWSIPITRPAGVTSANYQMDSLVFGDLIEVPGKLQETADGTAVTQFTVQTKGRIVRLTA